MEQVPSPSPWKKETLSTLISDPSHQQWTSGLPRPHPRRPCPHLERAAEDPNHEHSHGEVLGQHIPPGFEQLEGRLRLRELLELCHRNHLACGRGGRRPGTLSRGHLATACTGAGHRPMPPAPGLADALPPPPEFTSLWSQEAPVLTTCAARPLVLF